MSDTVKQNSLWWPKVFTKQNGFAVLFFGLAVLVLGLFGGEVPACKLLNILLTKNTYFYSTLWGSCLIYGSYCESEQELKQVCLCAVLLAAVAMLIPHESSLNILLQLVVCVWLGSLICLLLKAMQQDALPRKKTLTALLCCVFLPVTMVISLYFLRLTVLYDHKTYDWLLYAVDATLGGHINFAVGQFYQQLPIQAQLCFRATYSTLPVAWAIVLCIQNFTRDTIAPQMLMEFVVLGLLGGSLYHIIPAYGPCFAFSQFWPLHAPVTPLLPGAIDYNGFYPRNALPSLHTAWSFCIWRQTRSFNRGLRILATAWLIMMLVTLLALGQHYVVDIVVGFVLAVLVRGVCAISLPLLSAARINAIIYSALFAVFWYALILWGIPLLRVSSIIPWTLVLITIFMVGKAEHHLAVLQKFVPQK